MQMAVYDPFFAPEAGVLTRKYVFVTCTEVAEHFCRPCQAWVRNGEPCALRRLARRDDVTA